MQDAGGEGSRGRETCQNEVERRKESDRAALGGRHITLQSLTVCSDHVRLHHSGSADEIPGYSHTHTLRQEDPTARQIML